ncbi:MAG: SDR family oxidoreductase [Chloroflexi bacterium]|nr:SDR family oxidoreductase [Chloroflexota bacterium]
MTEKWALILGASSGMGGATSRALARAGFNIFGVHFDLRTTLPLAKAVQADCDAAGVKTQFFNQNAADDAKRQMALDKMQEALKAEGGHVWVMLHSLAFGSLLPFIHEDPKQAVSRAQMEMTLDVMSSSLVYWTQDLFRRGMLTRGSKIFSMTSAGSHRVIVGYGPVSAAKAALESHTRQLALELAPHGIFVNCIQAGVTDTPALRRIPGNEKIVAEAIAHNPGERLTMPDDVAQTVVSMCDERVAWINGTVIKVDMGEDNV